MPTKPSYAAKTLERVTYIRSKLEDIESAALVQSQPRLSQFIRAALSEAARIEDELNTSANGRK